MLSKAVDKEPGHHQSIGERYESDEHGAGRAHQHGYCAEPAAAEKPEGSRYENGQESGKFAGEFEKRAPKTIEDKTLIEKIIENGVEDAISDPHGKSCAEKELEFPGRLGDMRKRGWNDFSLLVKKSN
jgi:hypothetical protein